MKREAILNKVCSQTKFFSLRGTLKTAATHNVREILNKVLKILGESVE